MIFVIIFEKLSVYAKKLGMIKFFLIYNYIPCYLTNIK